MEPSGAEATPAAWPNRAAAAAAIAGSAVAVYAKSAGYGLFADDYQWLVAAQQFDRSERGLTPFFILCTLLVARSAAFASKNVRPWQDAARPYAEYERMMRSSHPAPPPGATIDVPRPRDFQPHYVPALLQWAYDDLTLRVNVID